MLSAEQLTRMSELLDEALLLSRQGRQRWLEVLAPEHQDLAAALREVLLNSPDQPGAATTLGTLPKLEIDPPIGTPSTISAGEHIGPYQLLRRLGSGGMAEVWLAQRADGAFKRNVALKLPILARLREDLAQRFARERDILAALEHPNIARLYDAGISPGGLPYLSMEYVAGEPLTDWCDAHRLDVRGRLNLFLEVLDAVQYAHARRVLHRDIKPSNIMVTGSGHVRLLDFGVAKLLAEEDEGAQLTQIYGPALTPEYASPELLMGNPVDAGSDIYSLGVVLNELLAGSRPYRLKSSASRTLLEQAVIEARVYKPSTQLTEKAALARATTADKLARRLRGDLDAIVLRALAKLPADRYPSAVALADDLHRYLRGEPVQARPNRLQYRLGKFVLRHRSATAAVAVGVALVAALIVRGLAPRGSGPDAAGSQPAVGTAVTERAAAPAAVESSIAVLPFLDMSESKDQEYFSDGLSEALIDQLSRNPDLRVISRTSSFQFKGKNEDVRTIAQKLGVAYVLEGSVRKAGNAMRITVQLIRASDGSHLWSQTYRRNFSDIFKVQDEISATVAQALKATLNRDHAPSRDPRVDPEAYNQLLQGNYFAERHTQADSEKAVDFYQAATRLDPDYVAAWVKLASTRMHQAAIGWISLDTGSARARDALQRALRIDPDSAYAHRVRGNLLEEFDWDWPQAASEYQRALELDSSDLHARIALADLKAIRFGQFDERIEYSRQALARDPLDNDERWSLGWMLLCAGRFEESAAALRKLVELNPSYAGGPSFLGLSLLLLHRQPDALAAAQKETDETFRLSSVPAIYWALGRRAESDAALGELERKYRAGSAFNIAEMYAFRGQVDAAFRWLDLAYRQRDPAMEMVKFDPLLGNLRRDPRFRDVLVKMNLAN